MQWHPASWLTIADRRETQMRLGPPANPSPPLRMGTASARWLFDRSTQVLAHMLHLVLMAVVLVLMDGAIKVL